MRIERRVSAKQLAMIDRAMEDVSTGRGGIWDVLDVMTSPQVTKLVDWDATDAYASSCGDSSVFVLRDGAHYQT